MTWDQVRALADQGMDVESHTRNHRVLQTLAPSQLDDELAGSRADLEAVLGRPVRAVAYPVGRTIARIGAIRQAVLRAGYRVGFTNASGASLIWAGTDRYDLKRWAIDRDLSEPDAARPGRGPAARLQEPEPRRRRLPERVSRGRARDQRSLP